MDSPKRISSSHKNEQNGILIQEDNDISSYSDANDDDTLEFRIEPLDFTDLAGTGKLTREDLKQQLLLHFRKVPSSQDIELHFSAFPVDEEERIDFDDWAKFMRNIPDSCALKSDLLCQKFFEWYDTGNKGYLDVNDVLRVMNEFGSDPLSEKLVESEIAAYDLDKDGYLDRKEFKMMMMPVLRVISERKKMDEIP